MATGGASVSYLQRRLSIGYARAARIVDQMEEKGYISRHPLPNDKRQFSVYPTEKLLAVLPEIREASIEWMNLLSEGIPQDELAIFDSVLQRMETRARDIIKKQEESK